MGLLDQVLGAATGGNASQPAPPPQTALQGILDLLHGPGVGGLGGLLQLFQNHGLGHVANGWVGTGPNPGVSPAQLVQVLGQDRIAAFAAKLGLPTDQAAQHLSQALPHVVDQMTPDGTVPSAPTNTSAMFDLLKSKLLGG